MSNDENSKIDPIRKKYYKSLEKAEVVSEILFYIVAILSLLSTLLSQVEHPKAQIIVSHLLTITILAIIISFFLNIIIRLYLFPRAEDARRKDFLSSTFGFDLTNLRTTGYYNNEEINPERRMGLSVLENLLYSKTVLQHMVTFTRTKAIIWFIILISLLLYRESNLTLIYSIALTIFSENVIAKWLRIEYLLGRAERLFENTHRLLQSKPSQDKLFPYVIDAFADYETGKALGGILLSSKIFNKINTELGQEWKEIKSGLFQ